MTTAFRRAAILGTAAFVSGFLASACSGESGSVGTGGQQGAFVGVQASSLFVTIENRAAQPLLDVRIAIKPVGGSTEFTKLLSRLESADKRDISLGDFSGRDGTAFNLRVVRPKEIVVTAVSLTGQKFATTVPWTR